MSTAGCCGRWDETATVVMRYAFIGLGHLGRHLAASLVRWGFSTTVHDRDRAAAETLLAAGASLAFFYWNVCC